MVDMAEERVQEPKQRKALSPTKRTRLEETFKRASKKAATTDDFDFAAELLAQCVIGDPGNATYVRAYIENLQKKYQNNKTGSPLARFKDRAARSALKKALVQQQWDEAIRHGLDVLRTNPWDIPTLTRMATAAKESGDSDSELCYLKAALTKAPKDPKCNRLAAIALDELGLVNQAIVFWQRVAEALPKDKEAQEAISEFQIGAKSRGARRSNITAEEQEELVRQREVQLQEEMARQEKIREEEELARQQRMLAEPEPEDIAYDLEPSQSGLVDNLNEKARMFGVSETAESAFADGYDYGVDETSETVTERKKIDPMALAVIAVVWVMMIVFVVLQWGSIIWKQMLAHASLAWIISGVVLFALAMVLRIWQRR